MTRAFEVLVFAFLVAVVTARQLDDGADPTMLAGAALVVEGSSVILATEPIQQPRQELTPEPTVAVMSLPSNNVTVPGTGCISAASVEWCLCVLCVRGASEAFTAPAAALAHFASPAQAAAAHCICQPHVKQQH
jgi:hypothetical protein